MKDRILTTSELLAAIHWTTESVWESNLDIVPAPASPTSHGEGVRA